MQKVKLKLIYRDIKEERINEEKNIKFRRRNENMVLNEEKKSVIIGEMSIKSDAKNREDVLKLIHFLMEDHITAAVTGDIGSGKTEFIKYLMSFIKSEESVAVLYSEETEIYEKHFTNLLRTAYPERNIYCAKKNNIHDMDASISKHKSEVCIIDEVIRDVDVIDVLEYSNENKITIFSHYARNTVSLIQAFVNSLLRLENAIDMENAIKYIANIIQVEFHLGRTKDNKRVLERITEIIPLENTFSGIFETRDIVVYDEENNTYNFVNRFFENRRGYFSEKHTTEFKEFLDTIYAS